MIPVVFILSNKLVHKNSFRFYWLFPSFSFFDVYSEPTADICRAYLRIFVARWQILRENIEKRKKKTDEVKYNACPVLSWSSCVL